MYLYVMNSFRVRARASGIWCVVNSGHLARSVWLLSAPSLGYALSHVGCPVPYPQVRLHWVGFARFIATWTNNLGMCTLWLYSST